MRGLSHGSSRASDQVAADDRCCSETNNDTSCWLNHNLGRGRISRNETRAGHTHTHFIRRCRDSTYTTRYQLLFEVRMRLNNASTAAQYGRIFVARGEGSLHALLLKVEPSHRLREHTLAVNTRNETAHWSCVNSTRTSYSCTVRVHHPRIVWYWIAR